MIYYSKLYTYMYLYIIFSHFFRFPICKFSNHVIFIFLILIFHYLNFLLKKDYINTKNYTISLIKYLYFL